MIFSNVFSISSTLLGKEIVLIEDLLLKLLSLSQGFRELSNFFFLSSSYSIFSASASAIIWSPVLCGSIMRVLAPVAKPILPFSIDALICFTSLLVKP
jgi:hypothetical protein